MRQKFIGLLLALFFLFSGDAFSAWTPIVGIPEPTFGVNEVAPATPNPWTTDVAGFYYIAEGGTNSGNGYPANPRGTIPTTIPAGAVLELHGVIKSANRTITFPGTAEAPIFLRGDGMATPTLALKMEVSAKSSYLIIENILSAPVAGYYAGIVVLGGAHHIAIRKSEFTGDLTTTGGIAIGGYDRINSASNILLNNLYLHDLGDVNTDADQDKHCVAVGYVSDHVWLVNSEMARCSGDGIQINAGSTAYTSNIHHVYIGNNVSHHHKQTGMWVKQATDVILSSNDIYGHVPSPSSPTAPGTGMQYGPDYVWWINNKIHDNYLGIIIAGNSGGSGTEAFIIGNMIYNNYSLAYTGNPYADAAIVMSGGVNRYIVNNTISGFNYGISALTDSGKYIIENNILSRNSASVYDDIYMEFDTPDTTVHSLKNNIFNKDSTDDIIIRWVSILYSSLSSLQAAYPNEISNNQLDDPLFINPVSYNFSISTDSPAKDQGKVVDVFATFQSRYGIDIKKDISGTDRPVNTLWDIGAYEYTNQTSFKFKGARTPIE